MENKYELISFVVRGKVRKIVFKNLNKPSTPSYLASELGLHRSSVSHALLDLQNEGLVICKTPKNKNGRLYIRTNIGEEILKDID